MKWMSGLIFFFVFVFGAQAQSGFEFGSIPDQYPAFFRGQSSIDSFVRVHGKYPAEAYQNKVTGEALVQALVDQSGKLSMIRKVSEITWGMEEEAVRLLKLMPFWIPARKNGNTAPVVLLFRVGFGLSGQRQNIQMDPIACLHIRFDYSDYLNPDGKPYPESFNPPAFIHPNKGESAFWSEKLIYPPYKIKKKESGNVTVRYRINPDGELGRIKIIQSSDFDFSQEITDVLRDMNKWNPARLNGKFVPVIRTLRVYFSYVALG